MSRTDHPQLMPWVRFDWGVPSGVDPLSEALTALSRGRADVRLAMEREIETALRDVAERFDIDTDDIHDYVTRVRLLHHESGLIEIEVDGEAVETLDLRGM